jgi:predicted RNA methylase
MLVLAGVNSESIVYDLGCGDGEIVAAAARYHNAMKVVGIEQDQKLCSIALRRTRHLKNAIIINANYDDVDISEADVVTLYRLSGNSSTNFGEAPRWSRTTSGFLVGALRNFMFSKRVTVVKESLCTS